MVVAMLEEEINRFEDWMETYNQADYPTSFTTRDIARYFYDLGCRRTAEKADEIEYNRQRAEESVPNDLEEAAHLFSQSPEPLYSPGHRFHWDDDALFGKQIETTFIAGAKWQKEHDERIYREFFNERNQGDPSFRDLLSYKEGHRDGMEEQKDLMMKEAVEGTIDDCGTPARLRLEMPGGSFKIGDKVRVIVCKKEDKKDR